MMLISLALAIASVVPLVVAHGGVSNYTVGDTWYRGYFPDAPASTQDGQPWLIQRKWISIDPIFQVDNKSLACNYPGDPAPASIPINTGENITAVYYSWLHPYGPMLVWMADCGETCATFNASEGRWFKIWEAGLLSGTLTTGTWYQGLFQHWDGSPDTWSVKIPENLKPGNYLIRHEIIALHIEHKPQFYPECAHLVVSGNGTAVPREEYYAKIPGVWTMDQPEINIDLNTDESRNTYEYKIPGPPVWTG